MNPGNFFAELKRRNVYKVAVAYAIVGWLLVQIATQVFPFFEIPNWAVRLVVLVILIGFPIALVIAWAFELTPEGIKRTEEVAPEQTISKQTGRKLVVLTFVVAVAAAGLLLFQLLGHSTRHANSPTEEKEWPGGASPPQNSVAVLPFENLSSDKENAFFAQGIQDEIITTLSKISGLRVISRTSTSHYNSAPENLPEIARQLRVANILEGSVQKMGERVHINVQLIQADSDAHLWAQSYDRQLTDIFRVEAEVAKTVADSLRTTLSPQEKARLESKPTENADAYVLYLRGREYQTRPDNLLADFQTAAHLYEQAIALDPDFALAHARLSAVMSVTYHWFEPIETVARKAKDEAEESLRLQPQLGEGHLARGLYFYYEVADYEQALRELSLAAQALPNDADVRLFIAAIERRRGRLTGAIAAYNRAESIDPQNSVVINDAAQTYFGLRDWAAAAAKMDRVLALAPDSPNVQIQRAYLEFYRTGSTAAIKQVLDHIPTNVDPDGVVTFTRWDIALIDRDPAAAAKAVAACRLDAVTAQTGVPLPKSYLQGCVDLVRGDAAAAQAQFETACPLLEEAVASSPEGATRRAQLAFLYALLGRKEDALREGRRAMEIKPISRDIVEGAALEGFFALTCARVGDTDAAITRIERLLTTPFAVDYSDESITLSDLRHRWEWDPLRTDPRFQKILAAPEPKTNYK